MSTGTQERGSLAPQRGKGTVGALGSRIGFGDLQLYIYAGYTYTHIYIYTYIYACDESIHLLIRMYICVYT